MHGFGVALECSVLQLAIQPGIKELDEVIGYAMFSRFHLEGKYGDKLLMRTPLAVKTELQRTHISVDYSLYDVL